MSFFLSEELIQKINIDNLNEDSSNFFDASIFLGRKSILNLSLEKIVNQKDVIEIFLLTNNKTVFDLLLKKASFDLKISENVYKCCYENVASIEKLSEENFQIIIKVCK